MKEGESVVVIITVRLDSIEIFPWGKISSFTVFARSTIAERMVFGSLRSIDPVVVRTERESKCLSLCIFYG